MGKIIEMDCKKCNRKTTHIRYSNQTTGETVVLGILTAGFAFAARRFWWECSICGSTK